MTLLDLFDQTELEAILEELKEEFRTGVVSSYSSLGENATFYRLPLRERMEMVFSALQRKAPATYGYNIKKGIAYFKC